MSEPTPLLIYGASGHAKVVIDIVECEARHRIVGVLDDDPTRHGSLFCGHEIIGGGDRLDGDRYRDCRLLLTIGDNRVRSSLGERIGSLEYKFAVAVHPSAQIARDVTLGPGTVVMANVAVNLGTTIGDHAIVNTGATVDHDCVIGDFVHISPGAHLAGGVCVGPLTHIGIGASVIQEIRIGANVTVGAGAVVVEDLIDGVVAVGVPARAIESDRGAAR
ncbi:MAG: acetyltransferase [Candidatus Bipolaricaulia bacterium]